MAATNSYRVLYSYQSREVTKMKVASITTWIMSVIFIAAVALLVYFLRLVIKALKTYIRSKEVREEKAKVAKSLGEVSAVRLFQNGKTEHQIQALQILWPLPNCLESVRRNY